MNTPARRETHRRFPDLMDWLESPFTTWLPQMMQASQTTQAIRVGDYIQDGTYVVRAEVPGIDPAKDVEITVSGDVLRIHAERHEEQKEGHRSEFRYGSFTRSVMLPRGVTPNDIHASYDKGILEITVPMPEPKQEAHRVAVETTKKG